MNHPCQLCRTYHDTAACPPTPIYVMPAMSPAEQTGGLNGISLGEQQIIEKLDELIRLLKGRSD